MTAASVEAVREAACNYLAAGWQPLALAPLTKRPFADNWTDRTLTKADLPREFVDGNNIGLKCGTPSAGLTMLILMIRSLCAHLHTGCRRLRCNTVVLVAPILTVGIWSTILSARLSNFAILTVMLLIARA